MAQTLKFVTEYGIETVGLMSINSGTASDPGLFFSADGDTGFFSPASNSIALTTGGTERFRISADGALGIAGANYGTSGQFLRSGGGAAAPSWASAVTSVDVSGGTTGLTTSGGPVTTSGTITLAGTLAIANGGTGQTTAAAAFTALAPSQTGHSGKYLTTNGTSASWAAAPAAAADTLTGTTLASTVVSSSLTSLGTLTSLSVNGTIQAPSSGGSSSNALTVTGGDVTVSYRTAGALTLRGGDVSGGFTDVTGGSVTLRAGNGSATSGTGGTVTISSGTGQYGGGPLIFQTAASTSLTERLRITSTGAFAFSGAANYGTSGQVLTSNGNATPSWQNVTNTLPSQTGNSGRYLTTDGTNPSWTASLTASSLTGTTLPSSIVTSSLTSVGTLNGLSVSGTIQAPTPAGGSSGNSLTITATGPNGRTNGTSGSLTLTSGSTSWDNTTCGNVNITGGNINGGYNSIAGSVNISAGVINNSGNGGTPGFITFNTSTAQTSPNAIERLRITASGALAFGGASNFGTSGQILTSNGNATPSWQSLSVAGSALTGSSLASGITSSSLTSVGTLSSLRVDGAIAFGSATGYGTSGQVLVSNGSSAPSWQSISGSGTVTSVDVSGGTTGLTTSGGPVTGSGTITLAGTLAIANGGTGQTTASAAFAALAPSQTNNGGKFLTTDGTDISWGTPSGALPSQTGNSGRLLTTDGTDASWTSALNISSSQGLTLSATSESTVVALNTKNWASNQSGTVGGFEVKTSDITLGANRILSYVRTTTNSGLSVPEGVLEFGTSVASTALDATTKMVITAAGDVGIGTSSPASKFVVSNSGAQGFELDPATGILQVYNRSTSSYGELLPYGSTVRMFTGSTPSERFRISSDGAWGLGGANYGTSGHVLTSNGSASAPTWQAAPTEIPSQTGNSGKYLTTDGTSVSWGTVSAGESLPSQTGNSGKFLTTDGTAASWGNPFSGAVSFGARYDELSTTVTAASSTTIDCSLGNNFVLSMAASITTLTLSNVPTSGRVYSLSLYVTQDASGSKTITWPGSVRWPGGTAPTLTTTGNKIDVLTLVTYDGGSNWLGFVAGQNF